MKKLTQLVIVGFILQCGHELRAGQAPEVGTIRGIVQDEQGVGLAEVKLQFCGLEKLYEDGTWKRELRLGVMPRFFTDKDGRFNIPIRNPELRYDLYCDKRGFAPTFLVAVTNGSELTVILKRGVTVTGTVKRTVNGTAEPVAGAEVELRLPYVDLWYQQRTKTDEKGQYTFQVTRPTGERKWQVKYGDEVVPLDVKGDQPLNGPDFEFKAIRTTSETGDPRKL